MADFLDELEGLCTRIWERCDKLAKQTKYHEAALLNDVRHELGEMIKAERAKSPKVITTDEGVRDSYLEALRRVKQEPPRVLPPSQWPSATPLYQPIPGLSPITRVVD